MNDMDPLAYLAIAIVLFLIVFPIANYVSFRIVWRKEIREYNERHEDHI